MTTTWEARNDNEWPGEGAELRCPVCGTYIGSTSGGYFRNPPCQCGAQTVVRIDRDRLLKYLSKAHRVTNKP
jgi:hypothetical protein